MRLSHALVVVPLVMALSRVSFACEGSGECDWHNPKVTFTLAEDKEGLVLTSVVQGCPGMRAAHQERLEAEIARAKNGKACPGCPFSVDGLSYFFERTELGAIVYIRGPKNLLEEFRKKFDEKIAKRTGQDAGCPCGGQFKKTEQKGPRPVSTCGD